MPHPFDRYASFVDVSALKEWSGRPLRKSLRVNAFKCTVERFRAWAAMRGWKLEQVPWCPEGFFVDRPSLRDAELRPASRADKNYEALGKDLLHLLGHTYMQEAASMLPVMLLDPKPGDTVLDIAAAPGSKTTQIAARMALRQAQGDASGVRGVIVANDVQEKRLWTLKSALHRSGVLNVIVTKKVGQWFSKHMTEAFDCVLCDAPCTAQGTSRKDSDALLYCGLENVGAMARLQSHLLSASVDAAKVGGRIVYSTCTLTPEENEGVVLEILRKNDGKVEVLDPCALLRVASEHLSRLERAGEDAAKVFEWLEARSSQLTARNAKAFRLWPQTFDTEGFFCAVLRKTAPTRPRKEYSPVAFQERRLVAARQEQVAHTLEATYGTSFLEGGECLMARAEQLLLTTEDVAAFALPVRDYALGLPFGRSLDRGRIRIDHELVGLRGMEARRSCRSLSEEELRRVLCAGDLTCEGGLSGDIVLQYKDCAIGVGLALRGKLKNRLPRWLVRYHTTG